MNRWPGALLVAALACAGACAHRAPPPDLGPAQTIAVLPVNDRTGAPLTVAGASFLDRYVLHSERVTVGDVLAAEARFQLDERGFRVTPRETVATATEGRVPRSPHGTAEIAAHGKLDGLALYLEIRRWEPDAPVHTAFVIVGLSASLVEVATGKVVWELDRQPTPVATPGEATLESAYETASRKVITEIVASLGR